MPKLSCALDFVISFWTGSSCSFFFDAALVLSVGEAVQSHLYTPDALREEMKPAHKYWGDRYKYICKYHSI
jgi:hypothetical protein